MLVSYTLKELETALRLMKPQQRLYELVKREIQHRGHWKAKPRGKQYIKGRDPRQQHQRQAALARMNKMSPEEWSAMSRKGALARARKKAFTS